MTSPTAATILIVDDEIQNCKLLEALLRPEGYLTLSAATGEEALAAVAQRAPDLILLDVLMPGMDGCQFARTLKANPATSTIPIIMVTAQLDRAARLAGLDAGAEEFLTKPVDRAELWLRVRNLLRLKSLSDFLQNHNAILEQQVQARTESLRASELRFRQMAENINAVFFLIEADSNRVLYISPSFEKIWGRSCASVYANIDAWTEAIHPDDRASTYEKFKQGMLAGKLEYEYRIVRPDGAIRWMESRGFPVRDDAGKLVRIAGVAEDITERKQAAQELHQSRQRLDGIVSSAMDAIVTVDQEQRVVLANSAAERMFGYTAAELLGQPLELLIPERFRAEHPAHIAAFGKAGVTSRRMGALRPVSGLRKNGEEFPIEASISKDESTGRRFFTAILRDITERKQAADELRESERRFSSLLENVELISVMRDLEGRITYCNEYMLRLTGWQSEEVMGRDWIELFLPPEIADEKRKSFAALIANTPEARHHESEILTRSGERRLIRWNNSVLRSGVGDVIGTASIGEDITERKLADEVVRKRAAELERFHRLSVGRELQMIELKKQVNEYARQAGQKLPFDMWFLGPEAVGTSPDHDKNS